MRRTPQRPRRRSQGEYQTDGGYDALARTGRWALAACRSTSADGKAGADTAAAHGVDEDGDGVLAGEDCDDQDASTSPAAAEICDDDDPAYHPAAPEPDCTDPNDYNCDGAVGFADDDHDRWAASAECDDTRADIRPDAQEVCDGLDNDCSAVSDDGGVCPCDVEHPSGDSLHPYLFCQSAADWETASLACQAVGYHLVTLSSSDENTWVDDTADTSSTDKWWTGMNDLTTEGSWGWADGSAVTYTNWSSGEPNDAGSDEDCGQLNRFHPVQTWNDEPCGSPFRYICEYE